MQNGDLVNGKIKFIEENYLIAELEKSYLGLLHISEISDYYVEKISSIFIVGKKYQFLIIELDKETKKAKLSWKQLVPKFLKNPFEFKREETKTGFKNLKKLLEKENY